MGSYVGRVLDASHPSHYKAPSHHAPKPASPKTVAFLNNLMRERVVDDEYTHWLLCEIEAGNLTQSQATIEIAVLKSKPFAKKVEPKAPHKPNVEATEGYYRHGEDIYEVKTSKAGHKYAMLLVVKANGSCGGCEHCDGEDACKKYRATWKFAQGAMKNFQQFVPMSVGDAEQFGHKYGVCMCCGRLLTNPDSIARGIGPICAEKF